MENKARLVDRSLLPKNKWQVSDKNKRKRDEMIIVQFMYC